MGKINIILELCKGLSNCNEFSLSDNDDLKEYVLILE